MSGFFLISAREQRAKISGRVCGEAASTKDHDTLDNLIVGSPNEPTERRGLSDKREGRHFLRPG